MSNKHMYDFCMCVVDHMHCAQFAGIYTDADASIDTKMEPAKRWR